MLVETPSKLFMRWKSNAAEISEDRGAVVDAVGVAEDAVAASSALDVEVAEGTATVGVEEDAVALVTKVDQTTSAPVIPIVNRKVRTEDHFAEGTTVTAARTVKVGVIRGRRTTTAGK